MIHPKSAGPALTWNFLLEVHEQHRCFYPSCRDIHGLDCNYVLLTQATQFRTLHEGDKPFLGYTDLSCLVAVWGRGWCNFLGSDVGPLLKKGSVFTPESRPFFPPPRFRGEKHGGRGGEIPWAAPCEASESLGLVGIFGWESIIFAAPWHGLLVVYVESNHSGWVSEPCGAKDFATIHSMACVFFWYLPLRFWF